MEVLFVNLSLELLLKSESNPDTLPFRFLGLDFAHSLHQLNLSWTSLLPNRAHRMQLQDEKYQTSGSDHT